MLKKKKKIAINFTFAKQKINELKVYQNKRSLYKTYSLSLQEHFLINTVTVTQSLCHELMTEVTGDHFITVTATIVTLPLIF